MEGKPIPIVLAKDDHTFELDERALKEVLYQNRVKDKNVVVVSVAGAFRKGKSFLLDFFLRYLRAKGRPGWMGSDDMPLQGFSWRGGSERDTSGILLWSEVFLAELPNGDEVAVILMDTQGVFDSYNTVQNCATVFALSTLLSSVQIYNLMHNIQEDDLQHLQIFTEYGRLALEDCDSKPFQKLQFLIRDWTFPYEFVYGEVGGKNLLDRRLETSQKHPELQSLRQHIRSCYSDISCFLMPYPGGEVTTNYNFNGKLSDMDSEFKTYLQRFVSLILVPKNLIVKKIGGQKVKTEDLVVYIKSYFDNMKSDESPNLKSLYTVNAEVNNMIAVKDAKDKYKLEMNSVCGGTLPYVEDDRLKREHNHITNMVLEDFASKKKIGGEKFSENYKEELKRDLNNMFAEFELHNKAKYKPPVIANVKNVVIPALVGISSILAGAAIIAFRFFMR